MLIGWGACGLLAKWLASRSWGCVGWRYARLQPACLGAAGAPLPCPAASPPGPLQNVPTIVPVLEKEYRNASRRLEETQVELHDLHPEKLKVG